MKEALVNAGGIPSDIRVAREGPYFNGAYKWDIIFPKGFSFHGAKIEVARTGGGAVKLQGTSADVITRVSRLGTAPASGYFTLSLNRGSIFKPETTKAIPVNCSVDLLKSTLEELDSVSEVAISSHSLDINATGRGAVRWDVTFVSMHDSGDLPMLSLEHNIRPVPTHKRGSVTIDILESRKGLSNPVYRFTLGHSDYFRLICDEKLGSYLKGNASVLEIEAELKALSGVQNVAIYIYGEQNFTELFVLQMSDSLCKYSFALNLFEICKDAENSLCFTKTVPVEKWTDKTIIDVSGNFSLSYTNPRLNFTTADISVDAPATAVKDALVSIPFMTNVSVAASHYIRQSSAGFFVEKMFHINFREMLPDYNITAYGDSSPNFVIDDCRVHGTALSDSAVSTPIRTKMAEETRTLKALGRTINVDVTLNGVDFSESKTFFRYRPSFHITHLVPPRGPMKGGTEILVHGVGFDDFIPLRCRFRLSIFSAENLSSWNKDSEWIEDSIYSHAQFLNGTLIKCYSPPAIDHGNYYLSLFNPLDMVTDELSTELLYVYDRPLTISEISPTHGSSSGNTSITIFGGPFLATEQYLKCRFGDFVVHAYFISEFKIICSTPMRQPGYVTVEVTQNGVDYIESEQPFHFHDNFYFEFIRPLSGPALHDTEVHIFGSGFYDAPSSSCKVGSSVLILVYVNENELVCTLPALSSQESLMWLKLPSQVNSRRPLLQVAYDAETYDYPLYKSLLVSIDVSLNGQEYVDTGLKYLYQEEVNVIGISRTVGPMIGGTPVFILGSGFVNSSKLACRYADISSRAIFLTRNVIMCPSPALFSEDNPNEFSVKLGISNNAEAFSSFSTKFSYYVHLHSGIYQPGVEQSTELRCPRGTYCSQQFSSNFTLCPSGTYQPAFGQHSCEKCPVGSFCPLAGSPVPRLCPKGYLCDISGLGHAEIPCPGGFSCGIGTGRSDTHCGGAYGMRSDICWDNSTDDFGLQASTFPARFWDERHLLPLDSTEPGANRGRFCSIAQVCQHDDEGNNVPPRPLPCPPGFYCQPGTSENSTVLSLFTTPQPCVGTSFCPHSSSQPKGKSECPRGFFCRFGQRMPCPVGSECPFEGLWDPIPCSPGTFNYMIGQVRCSLCSIGHYCSGYGRLDPALCPHGMVCSRKGLVSPNLRCPAGFYCLNGTQTSDPFRNDTTLRPYPCSPGTYCSSGTGYNTVKEGDFLYAQPCSAGFYCEAASLSATGSGPCPPGFLCPKGTATPIPTPRGYFTRFSGTILPTACVSRLLRSTN